MASPWWDCHPPVGAFGNFKGLPLISAVLKVAVLAVFVCFVLLFVCLFLTSTVQGTQNTFLKLFFENLLFLKVSD